MRDHPSAVPQLIARREPTTEPTAADAVDRVVVDVVRDPRRPAPDDSLSVGLPDGFQIADVITTHHAVRLIGRSMRAGVAA